VQIARIGVLFTGSIGAVVGPSFSGAGNFILRQAASAWTKTHQSLFVASRSTV
jgi:hypothetical protein